MAAVILLVSSKVLIAALASGEIRKIGLLVFLVILGLGAAAYLIVSIKVFLSKAKTEIELND